MAVLVRYTSADRPRKATDTGIMSGRGVRVKAAQGPVFPQGTKALLTVGTTNAQVRAIAIQGGTWANTNLKFAIVVSGSTVPLTVGTAFDSAGILTVTLNPATTTGTVTTTALAAVAALNADPVANQYMTFTTGTGTGATIVVAGGATLLATGANSGSSESLWVRVFNTSIAIVDITDGTTAKIIRREQDRLIPLGLA